MESCVLLPLCRCELPLCNPFPRFWFASVLLPSCFRFASVMQVKYMRLRCPNVPMATGSQFFVRFFLYGVSLSLSLYIYINIYDTRIFAVTIWAGSILPGIQMHNLDVWFEWFMDEEVWILDCWTFQCWEVHKHIHFVIHTYGWGT